MTIIRHALLLFFLCLLSACESTGRYTQKTDSAPNYVYKEPDLSDAQPQYEPYRELNHRPYTVLGKRYYPILTGKGYETVGRASWYGQKFHGHKTSNGETYDMFAMTAAHKTLPLPSYVRVTNLDNHKTAIVRVNDRGPFHDNRIIDLSYAAAKKLGYQRTGTARVKLEVIHVDVNEQVTVGKGPTVSWQQYMGIEPEPAPVYKDAFFIQVAALSDLSRAKSVSSVLSTLYQVPSQLPIENNIYKLRLGPLHDKYQAKMLLEDLRKNGYPSAYTVTEQIEIN